MRKIVLAALIVISSAVAVAASCPLGTRYMCYYISGKAVCGCY